MSDSCSIHALSSSPGIKRKRTCLSIATKLQIVNRVESGESISKLAAEYNIGNQTVRDMIKKKEKLHRFLFTSNPRDVAGGRKTIKGSKFFDLDKAVFEWFKQQKARGCPVTGTRLLEKAKRLHNDMKIPAPFAASHGWLKCFKFRHGISQLDLPGDSGTSSVCIAEFNKFLGSENFTFDQLYNVSDATVYWKALPPKNVLSYAVPGPKPSNERMTVLACSNATGTHKLKLICIGKSKNPRSFKGTQMSHFPVVYYGQRMAQLSWDVLKEWFFKHFVPEVREYLRSKNQSQKAVLFLRESPRYPEDNALKTSDGQIHVAYLFPRGANHKQPMDNCLHEFKRRYRKSLLRLVVEENADLDEFNVRWTLKDAVLACIKCWEELPISVIQKSWTSLFPEARKRIKVEESSKEAREVTAVSVREKEDAKKKDVEEWLLGQSNEEPQKKTKDDVAVAIKKEMPEENYEQGEKESGEMRASISEKEHVKESVLSENDEELQKKAKDDVAVAIKKEKSPEKNYEHNEKEPGEMRTSLLQKEHIKEWVLSDSDEEPQKKAKIDVPVAIKEEMPKENYEQNEKESGEMRASVTLLEKEHVKKKDVEVWVLSDSDEEPHKKADDVAVAIKKVKSPEKNYEQNEKESGEMRASVTVLEKVDVKKKDAKKKDLEVWLLSDSDEEPQKKAKVDVAVAIKEEMPKENYEQGEKEPGEMRASISEKEHIKEWVLSDSDEEPQKKAKVDVPVAIKKEKWPEKNYEQNKKEPGEMRASVTLLEKEHVTKKGVKKKDVTNKGVKKKDVTKKDVTKKGVEKKDVEVWLLSDSDEEPQKKAKVDVPVAIKKEMLEKNYEQGEKESGEMRASVTPLEKEHVKEWVLSDSDEEPQKKAKVDVPVAIKKEKSPEKNYEQDKEEPGEMRTSITPLEKEHLKEWVLSDSDEEPQKKADDVVVTIKKEMPEENYKQVEEEPGEMRASVTLREKEHIKEWVLSDSDEEPQKKAKVDVPVAIKKEMPEENYEQGEKESGELRASVTLSEKEHVKEWVLSDSDEELQREVQKKAKDDVAVAIKEEMPEENYKQVEEEAGELRVSVTDALKCVKTLLEFLHQEPDSYFSQILTLRELSKCLTLKQ